MFSLHCPIDQAEEQLNIQLSKAQREGFAMASRLYTDIAKGLNETMAELLIAEDDLQGAITQYTQACKVAANNNDDETLSRCLRAKEELERMLLAKLETEANYLENYY